MAVGVSSGASRIRRLNNLHRHKAQLPVNPFKTNDVKWLHFKVFWAVLGNGWTHFPCGCSRSAVISFLHFCVLCATCHYTLGWSLHGVRQLLSHSHSRSLPWILRHYRITGWSQISPLFQSYLNILSALNYNRILIPILSLLRINHHTDVATPLKLHHWKSVLISLVHLTLILIIFLYLLFLIRPQHLTLLITVYCCRDLNDRIELVAMPYIGLSVTSLTDTNPFRYETANRLAVLDCTAYLKGPF